MGSTEVEKCPELLRIAGLLQEVYFSFQCSPNAVSRDLNRVVLAMKGPMSDQQIADWLVRPNPHLKDVPPLAWLQQRWGLTSVLRAARVQTDSNQSDSVARVASGPSGAPIDRRRLSPVWH